jgi:subtilisin-like proprotein convertase family protein
LFPVYTVRAPVRGHTFKIVSMQPTFTLLSRQLSRLLTVFILPLVIFFTGSAVAQPYVNGNLSTGANSSNGTAAPAGFTWSEVQLGNTTAGYAASIAGGFTVADNFTINCGSWNVTKFSFFAYSTGYAGATSPFNDVRVQVFNTDPSVGSPTPIWGDLSTNRFSASSSASMYRIFNATPGTTRQVWRIEVNVSGLNLTSGNYWIEWQLGTVAGVTSNFTPPSTVVGTVTQPGNNAKQRTISSGAWANLLDGTNPQDLPFVIDYTGGPCAGTPVPGNTLSTLSTACAGTNFSLSLQNCIPGTGVTYQWQSAASATGPWTDIPGATSSTLLRNHTATTFYRCNVTCSGNTGSSTPLQVALTPSSACYCVPPNSDCTDDDVITRVRLSTLDNSSTCSANGYANYTTTVAAPTVFSGAGNPITVNTPTVWSENVSVWIDYNQNGQFDAAEYTNVGSNAGNGGNITNTINIPATALTGVTRMRVRVRFGTGALTSGQACTGYAYGETEDYNVNIQPCVTGVFTTQPASTSITCGNNATFSVAATGSLLTYTWQYRTTATGTWIDVTNGGVFSGATTSTLTLTNVPGTFSGYQFRALMRGGCTAVDFSNPATLTVNAIVPVVNPASATICAGSIQTLSLTNSVSSPTTGVWAASAGLPLSIPDNTAVGTTSTVAVSGIPAGSLVTNIAVRFSMTHTWVGDVVMNLRAPNGQVLNLVGLLDNGQGLNNTANFVNTVIDSTATTPMSGAPAPRTGRFRADRYAVSTAFNPIASTTGFWSSLLSTLNGNWTLGLSDLGPGDLGTLTAWEIQITYVAANFAQGVWTASPAAPNTMFTDAAATIPYAGAPATTIYVKPAVNTNYSVSFSTPTPCQSAVTTVPVSVTNPVVGLAVSPATRAVCLGGSTTFTAAVTSGGPITYQWERSIDGGLTWSAVSGATSTTLTISGVTQNMTGYRYRVVATAAPCGSVTSNVGTLTVNPLPVVTISSPVVRLVPGRTTTVTATSTPNAAAGGWSWTLNGGAIAGTTNTQVVNIDQLGTYQATVVDVNGCTNKSNSLVIGAEATDKLWIYPNPTVNGAFQVRLYFAGDLAEQRVVTIYNPLGQVIESRAITLVRGSAPYQRMDFNLGGGATAKGAYVVKVAHQYTGKVISGIILVQ